MRFGVCYNVEYREAVHGSPSNYYAQILEQVDLLESLGFDSVWFSEHHCGSYSFGNPAVIGAAAASRTKRIRIGVGVALLPLHHPIVVNGETIGALTTKVGGQNLAKLAQSGKVTLEHSKAIHAAALVWLMKLVS